ncbi:MAG: prefoldin subunit alpha [Nanopusillaceae archaeon]
MEYIEELGYLYKEKEEVEKRILDYRLIKEYILNLKKQDLAYINLGGMIFVKGSIIDDSTLLINIGRNIYIEKDKNEVIDLIDKNIDRLNQYLEEINKKIKEITQKKTLQS